MAGCPRCRPRDGLRDDVGDRRGRWSSARLPPARRERPS